MDYTDINNRVREFILQNNDGSTPIVDLVCEFCLKSGLPEEMVGDAISEDPELTKLIGWNLSNLNNTKNLENF